MNYGEGLAKMLEEGEEQTWGMIDILTLLLVFFIILYVNELRDTPEGGGKWSELNGVYEEGEATGGEHAGNFIKPDNPFAAPHPSRESSYPVTTDSPSPRQLAQETLESGMAAPASMDGVGTHFARQQREGFRVGASAEGVTLTMEESLAFPPGSAELEGEAHLILDLLAELLAQNPHWKVVVSGHSDDLPINTPRYPSNWYLSAARAVAVTEYLLNSGLEPGRITPEGHARFKPLFPNDSPENRAKNRRVEIAIYSQQS